MWRVCCRRAASTAPPKGSLSAFSARTLRRLQRRQRVHARASVETEAKQASAPVATLAREPSAPAAPWSFGVTNLSSPLDKEIFGYAIPLLGTLASDTLTALVSTAWVGRLGSEELAAVAVSLSLLLTVSKLINTPLLTVSTTAVAMALGKDDKAGVHTEGGGAATGAAVSSVIMLALMAGGVQAALLGFGGPPLLEFWGAGPSTPLYSDALDYLMIRAVTSPAMLLLLTLQGCFRGLGDTKMPLKATVLCNVLNAVLDPIFIFGLGWGVQGAGYAIAASQVASCAALLAILSRRCKLQLGEMSSISNMMDYVGASGLTMLRTLAVYSTFAVATGIAARTDAPHTAAHQICLQVWMAARLVADSFSTAAQAMLGRAVAVNDKERGRAVSERTLQLAGYMGLGLAGLLAITSPIFPQLFSEDPDVLRIINIMLPIMVVTQPFFFLSVIMDGIVFGVGGYWYAAKAMMLTSAPSLAIMLGGQALAEQAGAGPDVVLMMTWVGLSCQMPLRFAAIYTPYRLRLRPFNKIAKSAA